VRTTGGDPDTGYEVHVGDHRLGVGANGSLAFDLAPGKQTVELTDVAENCEVQGGATMTLTVHSAETVVASFNVNCFATGVEVTTTSTGMDLPATFGVSIAGQTVASVPATGSVQVTRLAPSVYTVKLGPVATNCHVAGQAELQVTVTNRNITPVKFDIVCDPIVREEKIAYVLDTVSGSTSVAALSVVKPDGSGQKQIAVGESPSWSPDGKWIVYVTRACAFYYYYDYCNAALVVMDPENGYHTQLPVTSSAGTPAWSPVGNQIAYSDLSNGLLHITSADGNADAIVSLSGAPRTQDAAWSPDGQTLAFTCSFTGGFQRICTAKRDGSQLLRLTPDSVTSLNPDWSRDGKRIAFVALRLGSAPQIAVMQADGSSVMLLTAGIDPAWSRDGSKLVFSRDDGLFTIKPDGTNLVRLTTGQHHAPAWRP
jgi:Tol biopolymer transport system component